MDTYYRSLLEALEDMMFHRHLGEQICEADEFQYDVGLNTNAGQVPGQKPWLTGPH